MSTHIVIMVEGYTEKAFKPTLGEFLEARLPGTMPKLDFYIYHGRIPTGDKLRRDVARLLSGKRAADAVIALTDIYTGQRDFIDAQDAKNKMRKWVGSEQRFHPHVALHDFEAWLLPFWNEIQKLAGSNVSAPGIHPEAVNHDRPPAHRLQDVFRNGSKGKAYVKPRDAARILRDADLLVAAHACPELRAFLNRILEICHAAPI